jgi:hypothetical protein
MPHWKYLPFLLLAASPAHAQSSSCVRGADGALQCSVQRPPVGGNQLRPVRIMPRPDLGADAARRTEAMIRQRREVIERQQQEVDEGVLLRRECLARASGDTAAKASCL